LSQPPNLPGLCPRKAIDIAAGLRKTLTKFRGGHRNGAEMAVSRTLEPDPGHTGVGTETAISGANSLLRFTWISMM
jgi:hypothetical protein